MNTTHGERNWKLSAHFSPGTVLRRSVWAEVQYGDDSAKNGEKMNMVPPCSATYKQVPCGTR